jgi:hypothetical protein
MLTDIPDGSVCYIDATICYYHLVSTPALSDDCSDLLTRMAQGCVHGVTSSVAVAEATIRSCSPRSCTGMEYLSQG